MIHNLIIVLSTATVWTHFIVSTFIFWVAQSELVWNDPMIIIALNSSHTTAQTLTWTSLQDSAIMAAWTLLRAKPSISFFRQTGAWPTWIRRNQSYQEWQSLQKDNTHDPTLDVKDLLFLHYCQPYTPWFLNWFASFQKDMKVILQQLARIWDLLGICNPSQWHDYCNHFLS